MIIIVQYLYTAQCEVKLIDYFICLWKEKKRYSNHNTDDGIDQDPAVWESVAVATRNANQFRYEYLPYLYSWVIDQSQ